MKNLASGHGGTYPFTILARPSRPGTRAQQHVQLPLAVHEESSSENGTSGQLRGKRPMDVCRGLIAESTALLKVEVENAGGRHSSAHQVLRNLSSPPTASDCHSEIDVAGSEMPHSHRTARAYSTDFIPYLPQRVTAYSTFADSFCPSGRACSAANCDISLSLLATVNMLYPPTYWRSHSDRQK